ncbi:hypothetical protein [Acidovorax sp. NCPPB 3576]|uniref:hypothetical protein n=1 Tax=Acidovorax sp. NCPPB 3576 TaxID=2940488 RepID=UPI00234972F4|nr:hypothetical protein [Acidovorax sp. NCPPB 3576]WCM88704.1 hypothetical protein M5C98_01170 [Acidovorax sp. NCPPB 3576]
MNRVIWGLALALSGLNAAGASAGVQHSAGAPQAIGHLSFIRIANGAAKSVEGGNSNCTNLAIDSRRVEYFWQHAVRSARYNYRQSLDQGDCQAEAQIQFQNRKKGRLSLDNATGWGVLQIQQTTYYLYCDSCEDLMGPEFTFPTAK